MTASIWSAGPHPGRCWPGGGGRIVNIASVVGLAAMRLQCAFAAAKAGVVHLTRAMALELGPQGVLDQRGGPGLGD